MARVVAVLVSLALLAAAIIVQPVRYSGTTMLDGPATADRWERIGQPSEEVLFLEHGEQVNGAKGTGAVLYMQAVHIRAGMYALQIAGALVVLALALRLTRRQGTRAAGGEPQRLMV